MFVCVLRVYFGTHRVQKRGVSPLELELQVVVIYHGVLGL